MDTKKAKDFFVSKAFASVVTILISYFFGDDISRMAGFGVSFAQEIVGSGIIAGAGLALWSRFGTVKKHSELRKEIAAIRLNAKEAENKVDDLQDVVRSKTKEVETLESRFPAKGPDGKFAKRPRSKPK